MPNIAATPKFHEQAQLLVVSFDVASFPQHKIVLMF